VFSLTASSAARLPPLGSRPLAHSQSDGGFAVSVPLQGSPRPALEWFPEGARASSLHVLRLLLGGGQLDGKVGGNSVRQGPEADATGSLAQRSRARLPEFHLHPVQTYRSGRRTHNGSARESRATLSMLPARRRKWGRDHEEDSCNVCGGHGIYHLHGGRDGRYRHALMPALRLAKMASLPCPLAHEPVAWRLAQRQMTMNAERFGRIAKRGTPWRCPWPR
jgi:hypothetical protein